jgi:8-oxo-dGTP pyrophosphatase MutT (NUDIX family)
MADLATDKTHLVLVNAVVEKNGRILVSQRSWEETHEPGKWAIPGGKVERTEGDVWNIIEKTLKKEVMEETGVEIEDHAEFLTNNTFIRSTGQHVVVLVFLCHWKKGEVKPLEDTIDTKWISEEELKDMEFAHNVKTYIRKGFDNLSGQASK